MRNPVLALPAAQRFSELPLEAKELLRGLLLEISADARRRASQSWLKNKAPMALYWKIIAVYARHFANMLRAGRVSESTESRVEDDQHKCR